MKHHPAKPRFRHVRHPIALAVGAMLPAALVLAAPPPADLPPDAPVDLRIESLIDDIEHRDERAEKARRAAARAKREADVQRLGTVPTPEALAFGRTAAAADPGNYRLRLRLIDLLNAGGHHDEADQASAKLIAEPETAENAVPRQRALVRRARIAYDRRDLDGARHWLGELASDDTTGRFSGDIEKIGERIGRAERRQVMHQAIDQLGTEATPEALAYGVTAAQQDPENFGLRTRLIGLMTRAGRYADADRLAAEFVADPLTQAVPYRRREMLLERARIAIAGNQPDVAQRFADQAMAVNVDVASQAAPADEVAVSAEADELGTALSTPVDTAAQDPELEQRVQRRYRQVLILIQIARIGAAPTPTAIAASRSLLESNPDSADAAFHYAGLLRANRDYVQAESVYRSLRNSVASDDTDTLARIDGRLEDLRIAIALDRIGTVPSADAIANAQALRQAEPGNVEVALHYAGLLRANGQFDAAEGAYREVVAATPPEDTRTLARVEGRLAETRVASEIARIGNEPTRQSLAQARELFAREPQSAPICLFYAQLLRRNRDFADSERIYNEIAQGPGATDPDAYARARLGIAEVYMAQGRGQDASDLVATLDSSAVTTGTQNRIDVVDTRIGDRLPKPGLDGHIEVSAGYDTNAISRTNALDEDQVASFDQIESPFETVDAGAGYRYPLGLNGDFLAFNVHAAHTAYNDNEASSVDRTVVDGSIAPTFNIPSLDLSLTTGAGYRYRERDSAFSRRTANVFVRADGYASRRTRVTAGYTFEESEDVSAERDGSAHEINTRVRYALTDRDTLQASARARDENADAESQSRRVYSAQFSYRRDVPSLLARPFFWQIGASHDWLRYGSPPPGDAAPDGARRDRNLQFEGVLGFELSEHWLAEVHVGSLSRESTVEAFDGDSVRGFATLRYEF